jgi:hypothetical protein
MSFVQFIWKLLLVGGSFNHCFARSTFAQRSAGLRGVQGVQLYRARAVEGPDSSQMLHQLYSKTPHLIVSCNVSFPSQKISKQGPQNGLCTGPQHALIRHWLNEWMGEPLYFLGVDNFLCLRCRKCTFSHLQYSYT